LAARGYRPLYLRLLRRPFRGLVKNISRKVQISNHGNPTGRGPMAVLGLIEVRECLTNEPLIVKGLIKRNKK
jgi:hypothetical protein